MEKTISSILYPIYKFNTLAKIWEELQMKEIPTIFYPKPTIKFITYNVWFEEYDFVERAEELAKILEKSSPDYICLHEVTSNFIKVLTSKSFVMKDYYVSLVKFL